MQVAATTTTLTFDDLPTALQPGGGLYSPIPNGYGGLQWNNFDVMNVTSVQQQSSGYHTGLISPNNVAFDVEGNPAAISSTKLFDLYSAYLTSTFVPSSVIEIQGFRGATEVYDNSYTITSNGPTFINFNYDNVDQVKFVTPSDHFFVVDDMTINAPDEADTLMLLSGGAVLCALGVLSGKMKVRQGA